MRSLLLAVIATFLLTSFNVSETYVYICNGPQSKRYHYDKDCKGLDNCSTPVEKVTLKYAKEQKGRTLCGWED